MSGYALDVKINGEWREVDVSDSDYEAMWYAERRFFDSDGSPRRGIEGVRIAPRSRPAVEPPRRTLLERITNVFRKVKS